MERQCKTEPFKILMQTSKNIQESNQGRNQQE